MICSVWTTDDTVTMVEGKEKPAYVEPEASLLWVIEAGTWEECQAIKNLRLGFGPYNPSGEPMKCPKCPAFYYPKGSGRCCCGFDNG